MTKSLTEVIIIDMHNFSVQSDSIMKHVFDGELIRGKYIGIHFFDDTKHQVREKINEANKYGIWEAKINVKHWRTQVWGKKEKASTFFPLAWTRTITERKLEEAFNYKAKISNYKYIGTTTCGIQVCFIYRSRKIVSCFPLY
jgi:hypothetical protein